MERINFFAVFNQILKSYKSNALSSIYFAILAIVLLSNGCYYDKEEELYPTVECATADLSFQMDILPIITNNCYSCHDAASNFGGVVVEGYDQLKTYVDNGKLLGVIKQEAGFSPMPKNTAPLLDCEIEKIQSWIEAGALNN